MKKELDLILKCIKCGHLIYTKKPRKLIGYDCPVCGEEWNENYVLIGEGDFNKLPKKNRIEIKTKDLNSEENLKYVG